MGFVTTSQSSGLRGEEKRSRALCVAKSKGRAWDSEKGGRDSAPSVEAASSVSCLVGGVVSHPQTQFPQQLALGTQVGG